MSTRSRPTPQDIARLNAAFALHQQGRLDEAWAAYEALLAKRRELPDAWHLSAAIALQREDYLEAERRCAQALRLAGANPQFLVSHGNALAALNRHAEAEQAYRRAIAADPRGAAAWNNLGNLLVRLGRHDEAIGAYDQAVVCEPRHVNALLALGRLMAIRQVTATSLALLRRARAAAPTDPRVLLEFARVSFVAGDREAALQALGEVLREHPDSARAHCATAEVLAADGRYTQALDYQRRALALEPDLATAVNGLVLTLNRLGRTREAIALIREHLATATVNPAGHSNLLLLLNYADDIAPAALAAEHRAWNERYALPLAQPAPARDREPQRRLRIGYVSSDFGRHSVSFFIEPVLAHHDAGSFEVYAYHNSDRFDDVTRRIVGLVAAWRDIATMSDAEVAALIRADRIDLLVDLNGHSGEHRLLAFARRPAPVQLSYLGYPNTTGLTAMQFRISDAVADPPGIADALSSETLLRLPDCFHCYRPNAAMPVDFTPPSRASGHINFASFNVISKLSPGVVDAWSRILAGVAGSTLTLKAAALAEEAARTPLLAAFAERGIAGDRLLFVAHDNSHDAHMLRYRGVDIALDPFPYNGTTTTCDALWMGVPVITLAGDRHAARVGASLLHAIGADALIAKDLDDYVARAVALAGDGERLAELHGSLRERMRASPLLAEARFTRQIEGLYREAWRRWCAGEIGEPRTS